MKIAVAQINTTPEPDANLRQIKDCIDAATQREARLVLLPEAATCSFDGDVAGFAREGAADAHRKLAEWSAAADLAVVAGSFTVAPDGRVLNTTVVSLPTGEQLTYDKIHLFDAFGYRESDSIAPGAEIRTFSYEGITFGLATCYDVRFPELFVTMAQQGASVMLVSASWGDGPGKARQWDIATSARSIDSASWVVACGQAIRTSSEFGDPGNAPLGVGHSGVVAPDGDEVLRMGAEREFDVVEVDPSVVEDFRRAVPVLENRRLPL